MYIALGSSVFLVRCRIIYISNIIERSIFAPRGRFCVSFVDLNQLRYKNGITNQEVFDRVKNHW